MRGRVRERRGRERGLDVSKGAGFCSLGRDGPALILVSRHTMQTDSPRHVHTAGNLEQGQDPPTLTAHTHPLSLSRRASRLSVSIPHLRRSASRSPTTARTRHAPELQKIARSSRRAGIYNVY